MSQPSYRIYPSLLQKFQSLLDVELEVNDFWNIDSDGNYKKTADELSDKYEAELLAMVNRESREPIEAASQGTAFNEIVDCLIENRGSSNESIVIRSVWYDPSCKMVIGGDPDDIKDKTGLEKVIEASLDGFTFYFNTQFCKEASSYFKGSIPQYLCSAILPTQYGDVELYGYIDELRQDKVYDIKTTSNYQYGKFENGWQKDVYPYCLVASGDCDEITEFEYTVFLLKKLKDQPITGTMYRECYSYNHERTRQRLTQMCERFIEWLEAHRDQIKDRKIFGGEKE
jgi:uncharacterized protein YlaI